MKKRKSPLSLHCSTTTRTCYKNIVWSKAGTSLPTRLTGVLVASEVRWGYIGKHELVYWVFIISTACFIIRLGLGYFDDFSVNFDMWWRHQATILCLTYWCSLSLIYRLDYTHYTRTIQYTQIAVKHLINVELHILIWTWSKFKVSSK